MFTKAFMHCLVSACLIGWVSTLHASPVSYAFSGTMSQPFDGTSQFSGTFTYDTDLPLKPGISPFPNWSYYSGVPADPTEPVVSLTFQIGKLASSSLGTIDDDDVVVTHNASNDAFYINETFRSATGQYLYANIGMINDNLVARGPFSSTDPPSTLNLNSFSMLAQLVLRGTLPGGQDETTIGTITSLTPVDGTGGDLSTVVPEPSSILVILILAASTATHRQTSTGRKD